MNNIVEKTLDPQGRILLPKKWREKYGRKILVFEIGNELLIMPKGNKKLGDLQEIEVDLKSSLSDWSAVKKELRNRA